MRWIKIINSFDVKFISLHGSVYPELFYICKLNNVSVIKFTYYNLYGGIM